MKQLLLDITKSITEKPDKVVVESTTDETGTTLLKLFVDSGDMGRIIGKQGKTITAIRTLIRTAAIKQGKRIHIELLEPELKKE